MTDLRDKIAEIIVDAISWYETPQHMAADAIMELILAAHLEQQARIAELEAKRVEQSERIGELEAAIKRQAGAARTLRQITLAEVQHIKENERKEYVASKTLDSERDANAILTEELDLMKTAGIIELAIRNPSVSEYMQHWERRAEAVEARVAELEAERDAAMREALLLAQTLYRLHYSDVTNWHPLDTAAGLISQIDNMVADIASRAEAAEQRAAKPKEIN